ncbi:hypothetical protein [Nocardia acidivorans]|uniref:hypothetical protein n=1 Tax=Nocardia acidivorans TaxID=404580 RepID=UPI000832E809|nr:hypothetical protein [Nocardia acidivorans]
MTEYILTADYFDQIVEVREDGTAKRYAKRHRGDIIVGLPDEDVDRLIAAGALAPYIDEIVDSEIVDESQGQDQGQDDIPVPAPAVVDEVPLAPKRTASAAEWQAYGVARGLDEAEAEGMTRAELIERFGA